LTTSATVQVPYAWSRDNRTLVFEQRGASPGVGGQTVDVFLLPLDGERIPVPLLHSASREAEPAVSPDGRWLAYTEMSESAGRNVYVRPLPRVEEGRWLVSTEGGFSPLWSADGKELYFISDRAEAMAVAVETEPVFRPGTTKKMFDLPPYYLPGMPTYTRQWDRAPDGRFLVITPGASAAGADAVRPQIVVVLNWHEELKRLVPTD
jgi:hypothetical protein